MQRPSYSASQLMGEIVGVVLLLGTFIYLAMGWDQIPEKIPLHYNFSGEIDGWGNKKFLILLSAVEGGVWLLLSGILFFPRTWNVPFRFEAKAWPRVYRDTVSFVVALKVEILLLFNLLLFYGSKSWALPQFFAVASTGIFFATIGLYIWRLYQVRSTKAG